MIQKLSITAEMAVYIKDRGCMNRQNSIQCNGSREGNWQTSAFMAGRGTVLDTAFVGSKPTDCTKD